MDKETKNNFILGILTVFFALIINGFIPAIMSFSFFGATISLGFLISGGIGALISAYIRKYLKF